MSEMNTIDAPPPARGRISLTHLNHMRADCRQLAEAVAFYADGAQDGGQHAREALCRLRYYGVCPQCKGAAQILPGNGMRAHDSDPGNNAWPWGRCRGSHDPPWRPTEARHGKRIEPEVVEEPVDDRHATDVRFSLLEM